MCWKHPNGTLHKTTRPYTETKHVSEDKHHHPCPVNESSSQQYKPSSQQRPTTVQIPRNRDNGSQQQSASQNARSGNVSACLQHTGRPPWVPDTGPRVPASAGRVSSRAFNWLSVRAQNHHALQHSQRFDLGERLFYLFFIPIAASAGPPPGTPLQMTVPLANQRRRQPAVDQSAAGVWIDASGDRGRRQGTGRRPTANALPISRVSN